eukprot:Hpha_TRINITY_DN15149_c3_g4::TRINITY_DN15149_c3_g4_i1::g.129963::m.129963
MDNQLTNVKGISPEEVHRFESLFKLFDVDGSGCISIVELADLMPRLGVFLSEEELQVLFSAVDDDGSGYIDFQEFLALMVRQREANQLSLLETEERISFNMLVEGMQLPGKLWPDSLKVVAWESLVLCAALFFFIVVLLEDVGAGTVTLYPRIAPAVLLLGDVIMRSLFIARVEGANADTILVTSAEIFNRYTRSIAFVADLLAAVPLDFIAHAIGFEDVALYLSHLRLFKLLRVPQFFPVLSHELMTPLYAQVHFGMIPIVRMLFWTVLTIHLFSCIWVSTSDSGNIEYLDAAYFVLYTLTTVGYGDVTVETAGQKVFAIFLFLGSTVVTGLVVGKLVQMSQQADLKGNTYKQMLETLAVLDHLTVPKDFKQEILALQYHRTLTSFSMYETTCAGMPLAMRDRMMLYARISIVRHVPIFGGQPDMCLAKLAMALINVMVLPEEYIIIAGEEGSEMFFLFHGMCDVFLPTGLRVAVIKRGGIFGEIALLQATRRAASIRSLTYCQLFRLDKDAFDDITLAFPTLREAIEQEMNRRAQARAAAEAAKKKAAPKPEPSDTGTDLETEGNSTIASQTARAMLRGESYALSHRSRRSAGGQQEVSDVPQTLSTVLTESSELDAEPTHPMPEASPDPKPPEASPNPKAETIPDPKKPVIQEQAPSVAPLNVRRLVKRESIDSDEDRLDRRSSTLSQSVGGLRVLVHCKPVASAKVIKEEEDEAEAEAEQPLPDSPSASGFAGRQGSTYHSLLLGKQSPRTSPRGDMNSGRQTELRIKKKRESVVESLQKWTHRRQSHPHQPRGRKRCRTKGSYSSFFKDDESAGTPTSESSHAALHLLRQMMGVVETVANAQQQMEGRVTHIDGMCQTIIAKIGAGDAPSCSLNLPDFGLGASARSFGSPQSPGHSVNPAPGGLTVSPPKGRSMSTRSGAPPKLEKKNSFRPEGSGGMTAALMAGLANRKASFRQPGGPEQKQS